MNQGVVMICHDMPIETLFDASQWLYLLYTVYYLHLRSPHPQTQTDLKAIWTRWARMSWASSVMRLRSRSCLMKLSSSEALAIQKASAPAMFFCFCNPPITTTHKEEKHMVEVVRAATSRGDSRVKNKTKKVKN